MLRHADVFKHDRFDGEPFIAQRVVQTCAFDVEEYPRGIFRRPLGESGLTVQVDDHTHRFLRFPISDLLDRHEKCPGGRPRVSDGFACLRCPNFDFFRTATQAGDLLAGAFYELRTRILPDQELECPDRVFSVVDLLVEGGDVDQRVVGVPRVGRDQIDPLIESDHAEIVRSGPFG